ncbi:MAG: hypothetical protein EOP23_14420 [Hyphomicrobiales bacterium]|nr:MAG: hypothetical protein EOP23_14420 [Hyphomicrobiales bacterium]
MPHQDIHVRGTVRDLFAHRFTLETDQGLLLVDLTPEGLDLIRLSSGDSIEISGERNPSEIKVRRLMRGETTIDVALKPKPGKHRAPDAEADPDSAIHAVRQAGFEPNGEPRRKPKHFEIDAAKDGKHFEVHVTFAGEVRHAKPQLGVD